MKWPGFFSMLQIAAGMSMAGPMYVIGFEFVLSGRVAPGVGFFALGLVAMFAPTYLVRRVGGPRTWIRRRLGRDDESDAADDERTAVPRFGDR